MDQTAQQAAPAAPQAAPNPSPPAAPAAPPPPAEPPPPAISAHLKLLLDQEKKIQAERRALDEQAAKLHSMDAVLKDPREYARVTGRSPEDIQKAFVEQNPELAALRRQNEEYAARVAAMEAREAEARRAETKRAIEDNAQKWTATKSNQDKYPLLTALDDAPQALLEHIARHAERTGEILSEAQAAEAIEARLSGMRDRFAKIGAPPAAATPQKQASSPVPSNLQSGSEALDFDKMSMEQRLEYAASLLKFESYDPHKPTAT